MAKSTTALQSRMMSAPRNPREAIRSSNRPLLLVLSWIGLGLSIGTNVTFGIAAELYMNPVEALPWKGFLGGALFAVIDIWAQWVWSPFHRARPDLIEKGWTPIKEWTMTVGYGNPATGEVVVVYSWGQFFGYLIALAPDVGVSFFQVWRLALLPFFERAAMVGSGLYHAVAAAVGAITSAGSVAPEQIVLSDRKQ